ncbi:hypothetical protein COU57_02685 [Candidatus Pacearchaeota archaeon CG10_big_fil_rev_8_21_14_0_10_32_14]|nr:MAG: hypothetical protein COU57_02685 [Candidatus Pacearchaeota archaeon CG10_big_fil_rev_8_21_14_0_10_32_14]
MAEVIRIPVHTYPDGQKWLDIDSVLGDRVIMRAHKIDLKQNVQDYDKHHSPEAHAKGSVKCKSKCIEITDKILKI